MSILDKASLIQIPSGYKSGKLYSIKPDNGDGDFTFSRSSSATRVNSEGLIETAQIVSTTELVTNGDFSNGTNNWNAGTEVTSFTVTSGVATIQGLASNFNNRISQNINVIVGKTYKITTSLKSNDSNFYRLRLLNGVYIDVASGNSSDFETFTYYHTATNSVLAVYLSSYYTNGTADFSIDNVSVKEVIVNDIPRLDYSDESCPSLLLEGQSTNLVTYSEDYSHSSWTKVNASVSSNTTTSPSGETNASTLVSTSGTSEQYLDVGSLSIASGNDYTMSVFVKKNNYNFFLIRFTGVGGAFSAGNVFFDINNGTLGTVDSGYTGSIESFGNGWYRCSATKNASGTTASGKVRLQLATSDNTESITGDGSSGTFIYGSQFEQSSYATSYIPSNSGSSTTRTADVCNNAGTAATFNSTEGVLFFEAATLADDLTNRGFALSDGTSSNACRIYYANSTNNIRFLFNVGGAAQVIKSINLTDITDYNKIAFSYKQDDFKIYINGVKVAEDTSGIVPSANTFSKLSFDRGYGGENFYGKTKQLMVFNEALSNEELSDLTGQVNTSFVQLANFYNYTIL